MNIKDCEWPELNSLPCNMYPDGSAMCPRHRGIMVNYSQPCICAKDEHDEKCVHYGYPKLADNKEINQKYDQKRN